MTGDEMERAMERPRQSQANFEAQADELGPSFLDSIRELNASQLSVGERLDRLAAAAKRIIIEHRNWNSHQ